MKLDPYLYHYKTSNSTMTAQPFVVVAGVGPGLGASVARRFAKAYPVVLLSRGTDKFEKLAQEINVQGGKAVGISADVSSAESLTSAFQQIEKEFPGAHCAAAVFNAAAGFIRKPFLELTLKEFESGWEVSQYAIFLVIYDLLLGNDLLTTSTQKGWLPLFPTRAPLPSETRQRLLSLSSAHSDLHWYHGWRKGQRPHGHLRVLQFC